MAWLWAGLALFFGWPLLLLLLLLTHRAALKAANFSGNAMFRYTAVQLVSWWATFVGWFLLAWPCYRQLWVPGDPSNNTVLPPRRLDRWSWDWLNPVYGQPEDGVSAQQAVVRDAAGNPGPYMPGADPRWRAYCWNARNSADGLKYLLAWDAGPLVVLTLFGRQVQFGWHLEDQLKGSPRLPVLG